MFTTMYSSIDGKWATAYNYQADYGLSSRDMQRALMNVNNCTSSWTINDV